MSINLSSGTVRLIITGLVIAGIGIALYLVQNPQIFSPKASTDSPYSMSVGPQPCFLQGGQNTCTAVISWKAYTSQPVKIIVRETGGLFATGPFGSQQAPWISATPIHFDMYAGNILVLSSEAYGSTTPPAAHITASPNPCVLNGPTCTSIISWKYDATVEIRIKENPGSVFARAPTGSQAAPWISASGVTFQVFHQGVFVEELFVKGVSSGTTSSPSPGASLAPSSPSPVPSPSPNTLLNGLVSFWNLNETSGNIAADYKGINNGTATGTTIVDGKFGKARSFNNNSEMIDLGAASGASLGNANNITVSSWLNIASGKSVTLVNHGVSQGGNAAWSLYTNTNNKAGFQVWNGEWKVCTGNTVLANNSWYLITGTYDRSYLKIYVNGVLDQACPQTTGLDIVSSNKGYIGYANSGSRDWNGTIDEVAVWNRPLTQAEVTALYNGGLPGETSLKGDLNNDGRIDALDYNLFLQDYTNNNSRSDLNSDGQVNVLDYNILLQNFGR